MKSKSLSSKDVFVSLLTITLRGEKYPRVLVQELSGFFRQHLILKSYSNAKLIEKFA